MSRKSLYLRKLMLECQLSANLMAAKLLTGKALDTHYRSGRAMSAEYYQVLRSLGQL